jgi:hypothetical protein
MWVAQAGQDLRFLLELLPQLFQRLLIQAGLRDHFLNGQRDVQASIPGFVHGSHPALPQQRDNSVAVL